MFRVLTRHTRDSLNVTQRRFRVKKKWATTRQTKSPQELALGHFDTFYPQVYGKQWPSMRLALLTQQKYCALVNTFADAESTVMDLIAAGAEDIVQKAAETSPSENGTGSPLAELSTKAKDNEQDPVDAPTERARSHYGTGSHEGAISEYDPADIHQFMPVKRVISDTDELIEMEVEQSQYEEPVDINVPLVADTEVKFPSTLKAFTYDRGEVDMFPAPTKDDTNNLGYYMMDAASILPVMALGLAPGDTVLDLCAAPGGKMLAMLQTHLPGNIFCVDHSYARLQRLKEVLRWYTPKSLHDGGVVKTFHGHGVEFCQHINMKFDKILVDVPCYADRHVSHQWDNNIFNKKRLKERLGIQDLQKELLFNALQKLKPGGTLVYSTCTLAMQQNDGTVHAALEDIWQQTNIDLAVVDTAPLTDSFRDTFDFHKQCRFGQLVIPNLMANFGPCYFSKIRRVK